MDDKSPTRQADIQKGYKIKTERANVHKTGQKEGTRVGSMDSNKLRSIQEMDKDQLNKENMKQFLMNKMMREYRVVTLPPEVKQRVLDRIKQTVLSHVNKNFKSEGMSSM